MMQAKTLLIVVFIRGCVQAEEECIEGLTKGLCDCSNYQRCVNGVWQDQTAQNKYAEMCENCTEENTGNGCSGNQREVVCAPSGSVQNLTSPTSGDSTGLTSFTPTPRETTDSTSVPMCPCACELEDQIALWENSPAQKDVEKMLVSKLNEIEKELKINVSQLTSSKIKKTCAPDDRMSASLTGYVGLVFIVVVLGSIVILDAPTLILQIRGLFRRLKCGH